MLQYFYFGCFLVYFLVRRRIKLSVRAKVGTNNIIPKAQGSFQPVKAQRKMRNLVSLISEAQCYFRNELLIQLKCNAMVFSFQVRAQSKFCN